MVKAAGEHLYALFIGDAPDEAVVPGGWDVQCCGDPDEALREAGSRKPDAVMVRARSKPPVIPPRIGEFHHALLATRADYALHRDALRAGYAAVLAPTEIRSHLEEITDAYLGGRRIQPLRIVAAVLDDESRMSCARAFDQIGCQWLYLDRLNELPEMLAEMAPDMLVLGDRPGEATLAEVIAIVRRPKAHLRIPVLVLGIRNDETPADQPLPPNVSRLPASVDAHRLSIEIVRTATYSRAIADLMDRDGLTALHNRRSLQTRLAVELARAQRAGGDLSFALLDLDFFKQINDRHGHLFGDRVLRGLANFLRSRLRGMDSAGRFGGEEMGLILPETGIEGAASLVDGLRRDFSALKFPSAEGAVSVSFSAGIAAAAPDELLEHLLEKADAALYRAKSEGRNRTVCADAPEEEAAECSR